MEGWIKVLYLTTLDKYISYKINNLCISRDGLIYHIKNKTKDRLTIQEFINLKEKQYVNNSRNS